MVGAKNNNKIITAKRNHLNFVGKYFKSFKFCEIERMWMNGGSFAFFGITHVVILVGNEEGYFGIIRAYFCYLFDLLPPMTIKHADHYS